MHLLKIRIAISILFLASHPLVQAQEAAVLMMPTPAGENTGLSRLITDAKGRVHLSWVETKEAPSSLRYSLHYATLTNSKWSAPGLIGQGDDWFVNWADFPFLAVNDKGMTAHWLSKSSLDTYDYDVKATFFDQTTDSWSEARIIHKDGVSAEHGFVSMFPMRGGRTFISWLDGRNTKLEKSHADGLTMSGGMTLRAGIFNGDGETLEEWALDDLTCDCCQTSAAMSARGPVVVYRDRSAHEIRDIYITRFVDDSWSIPVPVYSDHWKIAGCPVNGPSVAARANMVAVTWFTAKDDHPKVSLAISHDDGETFGVPLTVADGSTIGRTGITILDSGDIAISWLDASDSDAQLKLGLYSPEGGLLGMVKVVDTKASRRSGFPVIASRENDVYVTWTDLGDKQQVKVARVRF